LRFPVVSIVRRHSERSVSKGHEHAALHDTAVIVVLRFGKKTVGALGPLLSNLERAHQPDKPGVGVRLPTFGSGVEPAQRGSFWEFRFGGHRAR
jgi:hypothetical protein